MRSHSETHVAIKCNRCVSAKPNIARRPTAPDLAVRASGNAKLRKGTTNVRLSIRKRGDRLPLIAAVTFGRKRNARDDERSCLQGINSTSERFSSHYSDAPNGAVAVQGGGKAARR
jgi:hypothetical protein